MSMIEKRGGGAGGGAASLQPVLHNAMSDAAHLRREIGGVIERAQKRVPATDA